MDVERERGRTRVGAAGGEGNEEGEKSRDDVRRSSNSELELISA